MTKTMTLYIYDARICNGLKVACYFRSHPPVVNRPHATAGSPKSNMLQSQNQKITLEDVKIVAMDNVVTDHENEGTVHSKSFK